MLVTLPFSNGTFVMASGHGPGALRDGCVISRPAKDDLRRPDAAPTSRPPSHHLGLLAARDVFRTGLPIRVRYGRQTVESLERGASASSHYRDAPSAGVTKASAVLADRGRGLAGRHRRCRVARCASSVAERITRLALQCGVVNRKGGPEGEQAPTGAEVIFALQLDRLASAMKVNVLLSEAARVRLDGVVPVRRLMEQELAGYRGTGQFFTLAD